MSAWVMLLDKVTLLACPWALAVLMEDRERFIVVLNYTRKITRG
jgi:hypothetical protein